MDEVISVIIPVYNAEKHLEKCVRSVFSQTYRNLEIILVDDGSTDNSLVICEGLKKVDSRVLVIHQNNGGVSSARNKGLDVASGDYIGFVDSDDWIEPKMYETLYHLAKKHRADIAACGYVEERINGTFLTRSAQSDKIVLNQKEALEMALGYDYFKGFLWNKLFSSKIFNSGKKIRLDEEIHISEDLLCVCKCILKSRLLVFDSEPLYHYINNELGAMKGQFHPSKATVIDAVLKIKESVSPLYPELNHIIRIHFVKSNLFLMISLINSNCLDIELMGKLKENLRSSLHMIIGTGDLSRREILYTILISCNPLIFAKLYRGTKKLYSKG